MSKSLLSSFLNGIADVLEVFSFERKEDVKLFDDRSISISLLTLAIAVSFSKTVYSPLIVLLLIAILARLFKVDVRYTLKVASVVAIFVMGVTLPMALYQAYISYDVKGGLLASLMPIASSVTIPLILRAVAAATAVTLMVQCLGLTRLMKVLRSLRFPPKLLFVLTLYIRYIPIMLRRLVRLFSAREARLLSKSKSKNSWFMLSTVAGSLLIIGFEKALRLQMALKARGLHYDLIPTYSGKISLQDSIFMALMLGLAFMLVLM
ncbi:MAG: energy-coupling factor transporter transmembrane component T [Candidatus Nezhaarchaeales archaeon]